MRTEPLPGYQLQLKGLHILTITLKHPKELVMVIICIIQDTTYHISEQLLLVIQQSLDGSVSCPP